MYRLFKMLGIIETGFRILFAFAFECRYTQSTLDKVGNKAIWDLRKKLQAP